MFHVRLGGSNGTTKDKDARFVPVHARIRPLIAALSRGDSHVFPGIRERRLLGRVKEMCGELKFLKASEFKLHSFRHHFASLCANHAVAYRKALSWLGHSDSSILALYYHLSDSDSQAAMESLGGGPPSAKESGGIVEGNLRAKGGSTIEKEPEVVLQQSLVELLGKLTERGGFEPPKRLPVYSISSAAPSAARTPLQAPRFRAGRRV
jgi:hypothetical protein